MFPARRQQALDGVLLPGDSMAVEIVSEAFTEAEISWGDFMATAAVESRSEFRRFLPFTLFQTITAPDFVALQSPS